MIYLADLHIHSKYSRATSKDCDLRELVRWACVKGTMVLTTGDCTHPAWSNDIKTQLEPVGDGLFRLRDEFLPEDPGIPHGLRPSDIRFILGVEISSIYKKNGATRKVHNLIYLPDLDSMERFNEKLGRIGNIRSDGRPILGLDSRDLLEIALETTPESFLIPAHIWTPWFSMLGSRSGFDSVDECFGDLTSEIFAVETGLSSDPAMNYRVSFLDKFTLTSNSDTHSPSKLGRQANVFSGRPGYKAIREAIRAGGQGPKSFPAITEMVEAHWRCVGGTAEADLNASGARIAAGGIVGEGTDPRFCGREGEVAPPSGGQSFPFASGGGSFPSPAGGRGLPFPSLDGRGKGRVPPRGGNAGERRDRQRMLGTIDYYPEEGKYHLDGHRKCSVWLEPEQTEKLGGKCPVCGDPVTVGVMNRVVELADRAPDVTPDHAAPFCRIVPLDVVIGQALGVGSQSKKVTRLAYELTRTLGPELRLLWVMPLDEMKGNAPEIVIEAIRRVRTGQVDIRAGYDGEFGKVTLFAPGERESLLGQESLLDVGTVAARRKRTSTPVTRKRPGRNRSAELGQDAGLNEEQLRAVSTFDRPVLVHAGPGTGKTRTLTHRIAEIVRTGRAKPDQITAVTFTRKAAQEMRERLADLMPSGREDSCWVGTFHQLGMRVIERVSGKAMPRLLDEEEALAVLRESVKTEGIKVAPASAERLFREVSRLKQDLISVDGLDPADDTARVYLSYEEHLRKQDAMDLDDLIVRPVKMLRDNPGLAESLRTSHLSADEFQDVNRAQYELVRLLAAPGGEGLFAIGDPDQAIYGFRGADWRFFLKFREDYPSTAVVPLTKNYRSQAGILEAARAVLEGNALAPEAEATIPRQGRINMVELPNAALEGEFVVRTIDAMLGGASFFSIDSRKVAADGKGLGFRDFAVLYRVNSVGDALEEAFQTSGIPCRRVKKRNPVEEAELFDPRAEAVTLMTMHASKGLEFPVVFVAGCEDGIIPYAVPGAQPADEEETREERRLLYVAMTRCRRDLFLTRSRFRVLHGSGGKRTPSPFVEAIDRDLCEYLDPLRRKGKRRSGPVQCELF
ncbi:MAG: UvrD-helicase domain-containing protein [Thermodesulfobacteriota bacterium]